MLDTSWKATGRLLAVWDRLDVPKGKREKLAELTGIPATNLSGMNTGRLPMTLEKARRIADVVDGVTLLDLGAPEEAAAADPATARLALDRLAEAEEALAALALRVERLAGQVARLEQRVQPRTRQASDDAH